MYKLSTRLPVLQNLPANGGFFRKRWKILLATPENDNYNSRITVPEDNVTDTRITEAWAAQIRYDTVRMIEAVGSGHPGGSLSCADILACLYFRIMRLKPAEPGWNDRDRFILSKGHAAPALYAALARRGFFPPDELRKLRQADGILQGHPDRLLTPGVDMTTGCLGQGLSAGIGMALAGHLDKRDYCVYVILGDGEMNEGQVWEAAQTAPHYKLGRLIVFLDLNNLQFDGTLDEVIRPFDLAAKWRAFGWDVAELDGHDHAAICQAVESARADDGAPHLFVTHTIKGKGVPVMENACAWHSLVDCEAMRQALPRLAEEVKRYEDVLNAPDVW
jgi:transketolase